MSNIVIHLVSSYVTVVRHPAVIDYNGTGIYEYFAAVTSIYCADEEQIVVHLIPLIIAIIVSLMGRSLMIELLASSPPVMEVIIKDALANYY